MATTHTSNNCFDIVDIGHSKLQKNTTRHRIWEAFIGFCIRETVKMTSMMRNNLFRSWQLHRWSRNSLCLWKLNIDCHIHKNLSLGLKLNQVKIHLNIIILDMPTSLNLPLSLRLSDYIL